MRRHFLPALLILLVTPLLGVTARAQDLKVAIATSFTSIDPHFFVASANVTMAKHVFDSLVATDETMKPMPGLALSWELVDDTHWRFKLRPNVKFSDGDAFDAQDVIASIKRAPNVEGSPGSFALYTRSIKSVTAEDPMTVMIETAFPNPTLPMELSYVLIISDKFATAKTEEFNSGKAAVGTGAFKFKEYVPNERLVLERNDTYWGAKPAWHNLTVRLIPNNGARTAALLAGDVDVIDSVPPGDLPKLEREGIKIASATANSLLMLMMDHSREVSPYAVSKKTRKNPLQDARVRRALLMSLDRKGIAERIMSGRAVPADQMLPKGFFGVADDFKGVPFDVEGAKALLKEAGYEPNDIKITIRGPNERYVNVSQVLQAVAQSFGRIGIEADVELMPWATYISKLVAYDASMLFSGWGSVTRETGQSYLATLATQNPALGRGGSNRGRYSNPQFDALLDKALSTMNNDERNKLLMQMGEMVRDDVAILPLYHPVFDWAHRKGLKITGRADQSLFAWEIKPE